MSLTTFFGNVVWGTRAWVASTYIRGNDKRRIVVSRVFSILLFMIVLVLLVILLVQYNSSKVTIKKQIDESADSVKSEGVIIRPENQLFSIPEQSLRDALLLPYETALPVHATANDGQGRDAVVSLANFTTENSSGMNQSEESTIDTPVNAVSKAAANAIKQEKELHKRLVEKQKDWYTQARKGVLREAIKSAIEETEGIQNVYFKLGSTTLTDEASSDLKRISRRLKSKPDIKIEIASYANKENKGKAKDNSISQLRAETVKDYFVSSGVEVSRLTTKAYDLSGGEQKSNDSRSKAPKQIDYLEIHEK